MPKKDDTKKDPTLNRLTSSIESKILKSRETDDVNFKEARIFMFSVIVLFLFVSYIIFFSNYCPFNQRMYEGRCIRITPCSDSTLAPECSDNKPYRCIDGRLFESASVCGCPEGYSVNKNLCIPTARCDDGTYYNSCSTVKPLYCQDGTLIDRSSVCGCPNFGAYEPFDDICIHLNHKYPMIKEFFFQRYTNYGFNLTMHTDMFGNYQQKEHFDRTYPKSIPDSWKHDFYLAYINDEDGDYAIDSIVTEIAKFSDVDDTRIELATAFVQHMNTTNNTQIRYPYETIYLQNGTDADKSLLLTKIITNMGYGSALFYFEAENHLAVGIKCPEDYASLNTTYCYIETTIPNMVGNVPRVYEIGITLNSTPHLIKISDGSTFEKVETYPKSMIN